MARTNAILLGLLLATTVAALAPAADAHACARTAGCDDSCPADLKFHFHLEADGGACWSLPDITPLLP